jgi:WD40 repeat protein
VRGRWLSRDMSAGPEIFLARLLLFGLAFLSGCAGFAVSQGPQLKLREVHPFGATSLAFSLSGDRLASGGLKGEVLIWSVPSGDRLAVLKAHHHPVRDLLWIDEDRLVSRDERGEIFVWDTSSRHVVDSLSNQDVTAMAFLPSRRQLIVGDATGLLRSLGYPGFVPLAAAMVGSNVTSIAVAPDSSAIAVSGDDGNVRLFDRELRLLRMMQRPPGRVFELRFSPDGKQLAGGGWFKLFLWTSATGDLQVRAVGHGGAVVSLDYSPDGRHMATIGRIFDAGLLITDTASGNVIRRLQSPPLCGWKVRYSPDGRTVSASSENGSVYLYDLTIPYRPTWYHD